MENIDATVLVTALPTMAREFHVTPAEISVTVTAYLLALAVFVPVSGYMADRFGARNIFRGAILIFMAGSLICALTPSLIAIAAARFLQGMGGAMMVPVGRLVLLRSVAKKDYVASQAWLLMPGLLGTILGPPLGGVIVTYLDWRWIFWVNIPIGLVGILLVGRFIPELRGDTPRRFDRLGFVLTGVALMALMFGLELAGPARDGATGWPLVAAGTVLTLAYLFHARRAADPILDLSLLRLPTFRLAFIGGSLTRITQGAQPYLLALMMQLGFGFTAAQSGAITLATAVGTFAMKSLVLPILRRLGFRHGLTLMGILGTSTYALCGFFRPDWPIPLMFAVLIGAGFFLSFQFTSYNSIAYDEVPTARMSSATSFYSTFQQLSLSLGVCIAATVIQIATGLERRHDPDIDDLSIAFWIVTGISFCATFANIRFAPDAGAAFSGRSKKSAPDG